jgi:ribosomal protein S18 acetylase RimI-like enzyme
MASDLHIQPLHDRINFDCGVSALNGYLATQARKEQESGCCICFVATESADSKKVMGYYTLSSASIRRTALDAKLTKKLPRYNDLPATLLGRLAVDKAFKGQGLGGRLLVSAMSRAYQASQDVASWALVTDPKDDSARGFYEKFGFLELDSQRMFLPMKQVESFVNAL